MIFVAALMIVVLVVLLVIEIKAQAKRHSTNKAIKSVLFDSKTKQVVAESTIMGFSDVTYSLYDFYACAEHHESILRTIEYRVPHEMGHASWFDWDAKIQALGEKGERSIQSYINYYTG